MSSDIRLKVSFRENRKRKKLQRLLGAEGVLAIIDLWVGVATSRPSGVLTGWDIDDIALEANYGGDAEKLVDALISTGFVEVDESGVYSIRNWKKSQVWVAGAGARSRAASKKVCYRWCLQGMPKKKHAEFRTWFYEVYQFNTGDNTESILAVYQQYTTGIQEDTECNTPSPYPLPYPHPSPEPPPSPKSANGKTFAQPKQKEVVAYCLERGNDVDPEQWYNHYTSNGWMVGRTKMKDWKAAVRTWEKNNVSPANGKEQTQRERHNDIREQYARDLLAKKLGNDIPGNGSYEKLGN